MPNRPPPPSRIRAFLNKALAHAAVHLGLQIVTACAIVGAAFWAWIYTPFRRHQVTIQLISRRGKPTIGIPITIVTEEKKDSLTLFTDGDGKCLFVGQHRILRWYSKSLGKDANKQFLLDKDMIFTYSLDKIIAVKTPGHPIKTADDQPSKDPNQPLARISDAFTIRPLGEEPEKPDSIYKKDLPTDVLSANFILSKVRLMVRVDPKDCYRNRRELMAYHYFLSGDRDLLDRIRLVYYKRNGSNFLEARTDKFILCDRRASCFEYIGYQTGEIYNVYIQIMLENGQRSDVFQKEITYPSISAEL